MFILAHDLLRALARRLKNDILKWALAQILKPTIQFQQTQKLGNDQKILPDVADNHMN